jgi:hypothetical protein
LTVVIGQRKQRVLLEAVEAGSAAIR